MDVNDIVQERIDAARRKIANDKKRRLELAEARKHGLTRRHAQKLAHLLRSQGTGQGGAARTYAREAQEGENR
ncbi:hypothetical protein [Streptomyces griseus]|uniref:hypothetical protein n=1 Tax=Streptomyces griseus TaxID=1911 RepID=UPI00364C625D